MKLFPEQLGHLDITIRLHHGQMVAQFVADSLAGKELLESQLYQLRTSLQSQGIQVDRLEVLHQSEQQLYQEQHHQMQSEQQRSGQPGKQMNDEQTYEDGYEDMLAKTGRTKENVLVHGGTFDASV